MSNRPSKDGDRNTETTVYIGGLDEQVTERLLFELMLQAGPVLNVYIPKDRVNQSSQGFGFAEYRTVQHAEYASAVLNQIKLFGKPIRVNKAAVDRQKAVDIGAELFVGNLNPLVDEKTLLQTFSQFGPLVTNPRIVPTDRGDTNIAFVSYADFDASDAAIEALNGQYLMNQTISVAYAFKKNSRSERHGDQAERLLAAEAKKHHVSIPTIN